MKSVSKALRRHAQNVMVVAANDIFRDSASEHPVTNEQRAKVFAKRALLHAYDTMPSLFSGIINQPYSKIGRHVIGTGYHSIVLTDGTESVQKIHRNTADKTEDEQAAYITTLNAKQQLLLNYFDDCTEQQTFSIDEHPLYPDTPVVIARQALVQYHQPVNFSQVVGTLPPDLQAFANRMTEMLDQAAAIPDIVGTNNIVFRDKIMSSIAIIDTIPLIESDESDTKTFNIGKRLLESIS